VFTTFANGLQRNVIEHCRARVFQRAAGGVA
jgi:hypothetical protein